MPKISLPKVENQVCHPRASKELIQSVEPVNGPFYVPDFEAYFRDKWIRRIDVEPGATPRSLTGCYLLHFSRPISNHHTCQHYLGSASCVADRIQEHEKSPTARLPQVAKARGIQFQIARIWRCPTEIDCRVLESKLKSRKNGRKLCPICNPTI